MPVFTLKVLSGPLYGADISLPDEDVFFVVGAETLWEAGGQPPSDLARGANTLYLPLRPSATPSQQTAPNVLLKLSAIAQCDASDGSASVKATLFEPGDLQEIDVPFNQPVQLGQLWIALKLADAQWSEAVILYLRGASATPPPADATDGGEPIATGAARAGKRIRRRWTISAAVGVGVAAVLLALPSWKNPLNASGAKGPSLALTQAISGRPDARVLKGRDHKSYLLVTRAQSRRWSTLLQRRGTDNADVRLRTIERETARAGELLDRAGIQFWTVRMDDPLRPVVVVDEHFSDASQDALRATLMAGLPYARDIDIKAANAETLIAEASGALQLAGIHHEIRRYANGGASIRVSGAFDDRQLQQINETIEHFQTLWGDRLVKFAVQLVERRNGMSLNTDGPLAIRYNRNHVEFSRI